MTLAKVYGWDWWLQINVFIDMLLTGDHIGHAQCVISPWRFYAMPPLATNPFPSFSLSSVTMQTVHWSWASEGKNFLDFPDPWNVSYCVSKFALLYLGLDSKPNLAFQNAKWILIYASPLRAHYPAKQMNSANSGNLLFNLCHPNIDSSYNAASLPRRIHST